MSRFAQRPHCTRVFRRSNVPPVNGDRVNKGQLSAGSAELLAMWGSPQRVPVAAARTYSHRGVMTATPNDVSLGLTR